MGEVKVADDRMAATKMLDSCRLAAEFSPMPMAAVTGPGHILGYVNRAFCLLTEKTSQDMVGTSFSEAVPTAGECMSLLGRVYRTGLAGFHAGDHDPAAQRLYWSYVMWPLLASDGSQVAIMIQITETAPFILHTTAMNRH